ncbi:hypothetical protein ACSBLW_00610 [Thioclava sp. FR2]|uniref:hypothetical protein n=1 Tax=Thioclava sp. FR2 TaxID=3445780 RepID=UPI003EBC25EC
MPSSCLRTLLFSLPLCLSFSGALAVTVADCTSAAGCSCAPSPLTDDELSVTFGLDTPADTTGYVFVIFDGTGTWSQLSIEDIDITAGGDGSCAGQLQPEDGVWASSSKVNSVSCGSGTAMMQQILTGNLNREKPARVTWGGVFDGETFRKAWLAANPDPEASHPTWTRVSEIEVTSRDSLEGLTSSSRMVLLSPRSFRMDWDVEGRNEEGVCRWSVTSMVRKTGD